jgi:hypothetical protein
LRRNRKCRGEVRERLPIAQKRENNARHDCAKQHQPFDEPTAAARASTFVALVIGDVHLEMTLGYEVLDFKARFKKQIEEAIQASLR